MHAKLKRNVRFREDSVGGRYEIRDGHLPDVDDAMYLINKA